MGDNLREDLRDIAAELMRSERVTIPTAYPTEEEKEQRPGQAGQPAESPQPADAVAGFTVRYRRYDLSSADDRTELELVMSHVLAPRPADRWIVAREEWLNDKEGGAYVVLKYLVPPPPKPEAKGEPPRG